MRNSIDKRSFPRIKTPKLVIDYKIKGSEHLYNAELLDISASGLGFLRNAILNKKDVLIIKFPFKTQKVLLTGHVVRVDGREVGVQFENPENEINKFVETFNDEYSYLVNQAPEKEATEFKGYGIAKESNVIGIDDILDPDMD